MVDVAERPADTRRRIAAYLLVGILAVVLNALSFRTLDVPIPVGAGLLLDLTFPDAASYEWLLVPLAVLLSWHLPRRRRLLLTMVAALYLERVVTYLYFAPTVLSWQDTTPVETTPALLDEVGQWMTLDWVRAPVDWFVLVALMVVVIADPRTRGGAHPAAGGSLPRRGPEPVHAR